MIFAEKDQDQRQIKNKVDGMKDSEMKQQGAVIVKRLGRSFFSSLYVAIEVC